MRSSRLTLHRVVALNPAGDRIAKVLSLFGEDYRHDAKPDLGTSFCVDGPMGGCTAISRSVLGTDGQVARAFLPCQRSLPDDASGHLVVEHRGRADTRRLTLAVPVAATPESHVDRGATSTVALLRAGFTPTHVYGWVGVDGARPVWDTEQNTTALDVSEDSIVMTIPNDVLDRCTQCRAMLQVAAVHDTGGVRTISEARLLASVAEP
jgi:hypothetical protein